MNIWDQYSKTECVPDCSCEFMQDALISQPYAFWSSLAYVVGALILYRQVKNRSYELKLWTFLNILLAFSSHFTHASFIRIAVAMDFSSIVAIISFFPAVKLLALLKRSHKESTIYFTVYFLLICAAFYSMSKWAKIGLCFIIFWLALGDLVRSQGWGFIKERNFIYSMVVIWVSFGFFLMDDMRVMCEPHGFIHGHTIWHFGTAFGIYLYGRWRFLAPPKL